jgi:hypothetical protein
VTDALNAPPTTAFRWVGVVVVSAASGNELVLVCAGAAATPCELDFEISRKVGVVVVSATSGNEVVLVCAGAAVTCELDFEMTLSTDGVDDCHPARLSDADCVLDTEAVGRMAMVGVELKSAE